MLAEKKHTSELTHAMWTSGGHVRRRGHHHSETQFELIIQSVHALNRHFFRRGVGWGRGKSWLAIRFNVLSTAQCHLGIKTDRNKNNNAY